MKRLFAAAALAALAACGQSGTSSQTEAAPAGYPQRTASYVGAYQVGEGAAAQAMTIYADGAKMRVEGPAPAEAKAPGITIASVLDQASGKLVSFRTGPDAPNVAMIMSLDRMGAGAQFFNPAPDTTGAKAVGEDKIAGLDCRIWEIPAAASTVPPSQSCLTEDGIVLRSGPAASPSLLATEIRRGAQDAALFAPPAGFEVVDYAGCSDLAAETMAAVRAGKKPDMVKLAECETLGEKVSRIFGG